MAAMPDGKPRRSPIPGDLLARYRAGELGVTVLSRILHRDEHTVLRELHRLGIDTSRRTRRSVSVAHGKGFADSAALHVRVKELYAAGLSLRRVAKETGLSAEGIRQILLRQGVKPPPPPARDRTLGGVEPRPSFPEPPRAWPLFR